MGLNDGFNWIWPHDAPDREPEALDLIKRAKLPAPYHRAGGPLSLHLFNAAWPLSNQLSARVHVNLATASPFVGLSYIADDPRLPACCTRVDGVHVAIMGAGFVRRLIKIVSLLEPALACRPRMGREDSPELAALKQDAQLAKLIAGEGSVSEAEADAIAAAWPAPTEFGLQMDLGGFALFYDLVRLVWVHEWAHALCGHVAVAERDLHLMQLHEFSVERSGDGKAGGAPKAPRNEIIQAMEMHADEFAMRYCVGEILWGHDPIGQMAGPRVDLVDRLLILNVASSVFAIMWALYEHKFAPDDTFYPPPSNDDGPEPIFQITRATHPPAELRYLRFRDFQRDLALQYGLKAQAPQLSSLADALSFKMVEVLTKRCGYFEHLRGITPVIAKTPTMKRLIAYETHLLEVGQNLTPRLEECGFVPTRGGEGV